MSAPHVLVSGVVLGQPMGGVRRHNAELLPRVAALLAEQGGSLALLEGLEPIAIPLPPEIERIASDVPAGPPLARARREGRALRRVIAERARAGRPFDLVHTAHFPVPARLPISYSVTIHDLRALDRRSSPRSRTGFARRWLAEIALRRAVERAALVFSVSHSVRAEIAQRFQVPEGRLCVVPNAADHFRPLSREVRAGAPILCVGHLEPRKNLDVLLRALSIDRDLPPLVLAGAPKADEEARLRRLASELGVTERVTFMGPFAEVELAGLYARAACAVIPSRIEGFGIGALEAQRARVPLAVASLPALIEVAGAETPSFAPEDAQGCARAIRRALETSSSALERAAENAARFRWSASARAWFEAWRSITD